MSESEPNEQYSGVVEALNKYKGKESGGNAGLIGGLVAGAVFLIFIAIFAFQAWRAGKERAKLLHEKTVREEEAKRAETNAKLAEHAADAAALQDQADDALNKVELLQEKIDETARTHEAALVRIGQLTSWEQIDEFLKNPD